MKRLPLADMHILVMEDEILIAMDVEQLCRDHGAAEVLVVHAFDDDGRDPLEGAEFHAAILDVSLSGRSTLEVAARLVASSVPFVFATGHADHEETFTAFPDIAVIGKPYAGCVLIEALVAAIARSRPAIISGSA